MPRIFRQKDIESMKESDLSQEFVDYFNRMSDERKLLFSQDRPDLYAAVLSWKDTAEKFNGNHLDEVDLTELGVDEETQSRTVRDTLRENDPDSALDAIMHNAYDNVDIPQIIKDDFRPVEALLIDDDRTK